MRFEQRVCDLCGHRSDFLLVYDARDAGQPKRAQSMLARGWTIVDELDRCPDCTWMNEHQPHETVS